MRPNNRELNQIRPVKITRHYTKYAEGSVLIEFGETKVLCNATIEETVPRFLKGQQQGWVTAEYGMLPRATHSRTQREAAKGKGKGLVLIVSGGKLSAQSPNSRLGGWLHQDIGLEPVDIAMKEGSHGMPVSFEYIKEKNPDWLFVLDRSAAIGEEGKAAKDVLDNPLVAESTAWKKGQVVYLDSSAYLAAGGAQQLQTVAKQAAEAFKKAK